MTQNIEKTLHYRRDDAIRLIRAALRRRSGKSWSVRGGRGTSRGWITICAPPERCQWKHKPTGRTGSNGLPEYEAVYCPDEKFGRMGPKDCQELADLLGLDQPCDVDGVSIPSGGHYRAEYVARAEGYVPEVYGKPYWD